MYNYGIVWQLHKNVSLLKQTTNHIKINGKIKDKGNISLFH